MGKFFRGLFHTIDPFGSIIFDQVKKDAENEGGLIGHNSKLSNFWHGTVEPYATDLYDSFTGEKDRVFAREQADTAFERQKWLAENEPSLQVGGLRKAGLSPAFGGSNLGTVSTPQMATANRLSPSMGDFTDLFNGIFANVLAGRKIESEVENIKADTDLKKQNTSESAANVKLISSTIKCKDAEAENLLATYNEIIERTKTYQSQDALNLALASLHQNQATTEWYRKENLEAQTKHLNKDTERIDQQIKEMRYRLEVQLPKQMEMLGKQMSLTDAQTEQVKMATGRILQDIVMQRPNVIHAVKDIDLIVKTLGAQKAYQYMQALADEAGAKMKFNRVNANPSTNIKTPGAVVYTLIMSILGDLSETLGMNANTVASGAGMALRLAM